MLIEAINNTLNTTKWFVKVEKVESVKKQLTQATIKKVQSTYTCVYATGPYTSHSRVCQSLGKTVRICTYVCICMHERWHCSYNTISIQYFGSDVFFCLREPKGLQIVYSTLLFYSSRNSYVHISVFALQQPL